MLICQHFCVRTEVKLQESLKKNSFTLAFITCYPQYVSALHSEATCLTLRSIFFFSHLYSSGPDARTYHTRCIISTLKPNASSNKSQNKQYLVWPLTDELRFFPRQMTKRKLLHGSNYRTKGVNSKAFWTWFFERGLNWFDNSILPDLSVAEKPLQELIFLFCCCVTNG